MTTEQTAAMIALLRNHTALGRLAEGECKAAFAKLAELGYVITAPAAA